MKSIVKVSSIEKETIGLISENYYNNTCKKLMDNHTDKVIYFFNFQTLIMVLGEYEFNDMFEGRFDDMPYAHAFNMALLVFLAIIGRYI